MTMFAFISENNFSFKELFLVAIIDKEVVEIGSY
jgi:hypothetical protein